VGVGGRGRGNWDWGVGICARLWHTAWSSAHGPKQTKRSCQVLNWQAIKWQQTWQQTSPERRPLT